jgi:hypothetical protein
MSNPDADLRMIVDVERPSYHHLSPDNYFHVIGRPRKMEWSEADAELMPYGHMYKHLGDLMLDNFQVRCQGEINKPTGPMNPYGFKCEYYDRLGVDLYDCEDMLKVLRMVERKMVKLNEQLGTPVNFGQFVARAGTALGITKYGFRPMDGEKLWISGSHFNWMDASNLDWMINQRIDKMRENAGIVLEEA